MEARTRAPVTHTQVRRRTLTMLLLDPHHLELYRIHLTAKQILVQLLVMAIVVTRAQAVREIGSASLKRVKLGLVRRHTRTLPRRIMNWPPQTWPLLSRHGDN